MNFACAPHEGYSPNVSRPLGPIGAPTIRALFLVTAVPATPCGHTEASRKASPHSEPGGRTSPVPPTKAMPTCLGAQEAIGAPTFGAVFLGGAKPVTLRNAPRGPSESLAPFRVRQTNFARAPYQGYSPPISGPLGPFGAPTFGH